MNARSISVVAPVYNEEESLREFYTQISKVLSQIGSDYEIVFVDDGSSDKSPSILSELKAKDAKVRVLSFSRNFGHQIAVKAGIDHAQGDAVVIIDADLQDPPELITTMVRKWHEGYDVVYAVRVQRDGESFFKKFTAAVFYKFLKNISSVEIPTNTGDFRLISRQVADVIKSIHEKNPYIRGLVSWSGFRQTGIPMHRHARFAGKTKYPLKKMLNLAWNGITHFSFLPLKLSAMIGSVILAVALGHLACMGYRILCLGQIPSLEALIFFAVLFLGAIQLLALGVLGAYLGRSYDETRSRPLYILKKGS